MKGPGATGEAPAGTGGTTQGNCLGVRDLAVDILYVLLQGCPLLFQTSEDLAGGRRGRNITGEAGVKTWQDRERAGDE